MRSILCLLLGLSCPGGFPAAQSKGDAAWIDTFVPRMESAEAQLAHAKRLKRALVEKNSEERAFWRKLAIEAYQAVRVFHPEARAIGAEAAFRAGELLRADGDEGRSLEEFRWSMLHGEGTEFRARARLEIGQLHRRNGRWNEALEAFLGMASDPQAESFRRDDGWYWAGIVWQEEGRTDDARSAWRRVAEHGVDALARIQAYDALALSVLQGGDLEGAAGILDECLSQLSNRALEETSEGERVRNALLRMRVVDELSRAIARGKDSSDVRGTTRNP